MINTVDNTGPNDYKYITRFDDVDEAMEIFHKIPYDNITDIASGIVTILQKIKVKGYRVVDSFMETPYPYMEVKPTIPEHSADDTAYSDCVVFYSNMNSHIHKNNGMDYYDVYYYDEVTVYGEFYGRSAGGNIYISVSVRRYSSDAEDGFFSEMQTNEYEFNDSDINKYLEFMRNTSSLIIQ